ncbi:MAG: alpha/beta hydrolase [Fuerstiella sp.]
MTTRPTDNSTPKWWKPLTAPLLKGLTAYLGIVILLGLLQRKLLYFPQTADTLPVRQHQAASNLFPAARDVQLTCADGVTIRGWLLLQKPSSPHDQTDTRRPLVIYFHGNAGNRAGRTGWYQLLAAIGADVLTVDYHGYGDSEGNMSEAALEMDCDAAWSFATNDLGYQPRDIVVMGTSLGGAAAVYLTSRQCADDSRPGALVTVATFSSMVDAGRSHYPWLPVRMILVDRYPSEDRIRHVTCPILQFHGDRDNVVHPQFGRKLFETAPELSSCGVAKRWVDLPGVGHNDIVGTAGSLIQDELASLIRRIRQQIASSH